jgi:hypothetical protein
MKETFCARKAKKKCQRLIYFIVNSKQQKIDKTAQLLRFTKYYGDQIKKHERRGRGLKHTKC